MNEETSSGENKKRILLIDMQANEMMPEMAQNLYRLCREQLGFNLVLDVTATLNEAIAKLEELKEDEIPLDLIVLEPMTAKNTAQLEKCVQLGGSESMLFCYYLRNMKDWGEAMARVPIFINTTANPKDQIRTYFEGQLGVTVMSKPAFPDEVVRGIGVALENTDAYIILSNTGEKKDGKS